MILYHGSNIEIEEINLEKSKPYKDFGKGFYLSDVETQAYEMARFKVHTFGGECKVTKFEFDKDGLQNSNLKAKIFNDYSEGWLDFIVANRMGREVESYDFVYGPIADDKVGLQLRKYEDEEITKEELLHRLKYLKGITFQYFFGSEASIRFLKKL